jgi:uncharacterized FlaG/YvyC family protein
MNIRSTQGLATQSMRFVSLVDGLSTSAPSVEMSNLDHEPKVSFTADEVKVAMNQANDFFDQNNIQVQFKLDQDAGKMVFYLKDAQTGETLRQIPDETALRISNHISQFLKARQTDQPQREEVRALLSGLITYTRV